MKCYHCRKEFDSTGASKEKCPECNALVRWSIAYAGKIYFIPSHMIEGINRYIIDRVRAGDFLMAIFENDFVHALGRADSHNFKNIQAYADLLYNFAPLACWGSKKKIKDWLKEGDKK